MTTAAAEARSEPWSVPGPAPVPLLGAVPHLLRFAIDPIAYAGKLFERYGPIAALVAGAPTRIVSTRETSPGTVFVRGAELNRRVVTRHEEFHKTALPGPLYPTKNPTKRTRPLTRLLTGLFHVNGDEHRRHRRLLMPAFHKSRIESYRDDMVAITEEVSAGFQPGAARNLVPDMNEITLRIATKTLFGADMGEEGTRIGRDLQTWLALFGRASILPLDLPGFAYRRWLDVSAAVDRAMFGLIEARRRAGADGDDMLSTLLTASDEQGQPLGDDEVAGHASVLFGAGYETSSNALCWTLLLLSQHPAVMSELYTELRRELAGAAPRVSDLPRLPLLERVIKESLRLFPPAPFNHRIAACPIELGGHVLPDGTEILVSVYHTQREAEYFAEPDRFLPERWLSADPGPYAYGPFSAGPRMCIGAAFAMMELKIVLAVLLQRFRFELVPGAHVDRFVSVTLAPKRGLPMILHAADGKFDESALGVRGNLREMLDWNGATPARSAP